MKIINTFLTATSLLLLAPAINAVTLGPLGPGSLNPANMTEWGAGASSGTSTCASFSSTCSVGTGPSFSGDYVDNFHNLTADSSVSSSLGASEAHSQLTGTSGISTPHLTGQAVGGANGIARATAWGLEGYTYTGSGSTSVDLNISLSGTLSNPSGSAFTKIASTVHIIDAAEWEFNLSETTAPFGYFGEGLFPIESSTLSLTDTGSITDTISLTLNSGDSFYIWASLSVGAGKNGTAESLNSLSMSFSNNSGLVAASVGAVPVPAAVWLFGSGLLGLTGVARYKRANI